MIDDTLPLSKGGRCDVDAMWQFWNIKRLRLKAYVEVAESGDLAPIDQILWSTVMSATIQLETADDSLCDQFRNGSAFHTAAIASCLAPGRNLALSMCPSRELRC